MDQMLEKLPTSFFATSYWEDMANFALSSTSKFGAASKTTSLFVIFGCLCAGIYVKLHKFRSKKSCIPIRERSFKGPITRSKSLAALYGGDLALQRLVDYNAAIANSETLNEAEKNLKDLLHEAHLDLKKLQSTVAKLEMSGSEDNAVTILRNAIREKDIANKSHEVYEIEMLLVEMLIYKGAFEEALACDCLKHEEITDARRPLYKAILLIMLNHSDDEAKRCWEEFIDIRRQFIGFKSPTSGQERDYENVYENITDFDVFQKKVKELKREIDDAIEPARKEAPK